MCTRLGFVELSSRWRRHYLVFANSVVYSQRGRSPDLTPSYTTTPQSAFVGTLEGVFQQQLADALPCSVQRRTVAARSTNADIVRPVTVAAPLSCIYAGRNLPSSSPMTYAAAAARPFAEIMPTPYVKPATRHQYRSVPRVHIPQVLAPPCAAT